MSQPAVIVGSAQGIGAAIARRLATDHPVVLADVKYEAVERLSRELSEAGMPARAVFVDLTDPESIADLVRAAPTANKIAISAGLFQTSRSLDARPEDFDRILAVNLVGVFETARAFATEMVGNGGGAICAVTSIAARMPRMRQAAYCASKAGMRQALRVLGLEVRPLGVRINFVSPGPTATPMMSTLSLDHPGTELWRGDLETGRPRILDRRVGDPEDIAAATEFLLSADADHIALHDLHVDGGESLGM